MRARSAFAVVALASGCATPELADPPWLSVETPHFEIISRLSEPRTLEAAAELETFRKLASAVTRFGEVESPLPTRIYLFGSERDFRDFRPRADLAGYFFHTARGNFAAMLGGDTGVLFHEFTHQLMHNHTSHAVPRWLDEGIAEVFAATRILRDRIEVGGRIDEARLRPFAAGSWLRTSDVVAARSVHGLDARSRALFYAQAWALVHYLSFGRGDEPDFGPQTDRYLRALERGEPPARAFELGYGIAPGQADREVRRYVEGRLSYYHIEIEPFLPTSKPVARAIPPSEIASQLGWLALHAGRLDTAERYFDAALAIDAESDRALAGLGDLGPLAEPESERFYRRAIARGPDDPLNQLDFAESLQRRAAAAQAGAVRDGLIERARERYETALKLDPTLPETYAMYGSSYLLSGDIERGIQLVEHARSLLPSDPGIQLTLARLYLRAQRREEAVPLLETVRGWSHSEQQARAAGELLEQLQAR